MQHKIHFGVRSADGQMSNIWSCWTRSNKGDAYLTSDALGKVLKLSNHQTGQTHIAYHYEKREELFTPETLPKDRFILKELGGARTGGRVQLIANVFFPAMSLSVAAPTAQPQNTIWIPEAQEGYAIEVGIFRTDTPLYSAWPGKEEGASLIGELPLMPPQGIIVVWRCAPFSMPKMPGNGVNPNLFKGCTEEDLLLADRMVVFGTNDSGALSMIETSAKIERNPKLG